MEECQAMVSSSTSGDSSSEVEKIAQKSINDPASSGFVYGWLVHFIASLFRFPITDNNNPFTLTEDKEKQTYIINEESIVSTLNNNNNNTTHKRKSKRDSGDSFKDQFHLQPNPKDIFLVSKENALVLPPCKKTLILDLDETLVHSTLTPVSHHHLTVNVVVEDVECTFYVIKRPHVDLFIQKVSEWYDIIVFTASMKEYADPLLDKLDQNRLIKKRLFRDSCLEKDGNFVKDLTMIEQDLATTIIIDNSPIAYSNNVENAVPIDNWMGDMHAQDSSLLTLLPFLEILRYVQDVRSILSLRPTH